MAMVKLVLVCFEQVFYDEDLSVITVVNFLDCILYMILFSKKNLSMSEMLYSSMRQREFG